MTRYLRAGSAFVALLVLAAAPLAAQGPAAPDARLIKRQLETLEGRVPKMVFEELTAYASRWESLDWEKRQFLETCLVVFRSMLPHQIREAFREAEQAQGDEKRAKFKETLRKIAAGGEVPAAQVDPSVVVVIVGGDVDAKSGFGDPKRENIPNIWAKIRPYGTFVPVTKTMWVRDRTQWIGEFLTGISVNAVIPDGNVYKFKVPTVCDLFRKISGAEARDCWFVCRGDTNNVIYDYL
jgi:hypothetical protein